MSSHNGWAYTRGSGRQPKPSFNLDAPRLTKEQIDQMVGETQIKKMAEQTGATVDDVIRVGREAGYISCNDDQAKWLADFLNEP